MTLTIGKRYCTFTARACNTGRAIQVIAAKNVAMQFLRIDARQSLVLSTAQTVKTLCNF